MHDNADASKILTASPLEERKRAPEACHLLFCYARYRKNSTVSKRQLSRIDTSQNLRCHGTLSKVMFIKKIEACLFAFISTRIQYRSYQYWICTKTQKVSVTSDATLWAKLANCRRENFCSPILWVASVESTRTSLKKSTRRLWLQSDHLDKVSHRWPEVPLAHTN